MARNALRAGLESVAAYVDLARWQYSGEFWLSGLFHTFI